MTIEQLDKANELLGKIKKLNDFTMAFSRSSATNLIVAKYLYYPVGGGHIEQESELKLRDFPDLQDFISGYLSDKIAELKKQLEEL